VLAQVKGRKYTQGKWLDFEDILAQEIELVIHLKDKTKKLLASPFDLESLVLGHVKLEFLDSEEFPFIVKKEGFDYFIEVEKKKPLVSKEFAFKLEPELLLNLSKEFREKESKWNLTGCFHRMAFWSPEKQGFILEVEDIGRHNCVDRLVGLALTQGIDLGQGVFFGSARITFSLLQKLVKAGFKVLVSKSAVTTASVKLAREKRITLVGFAREERFTVFSDELQRIVYA